MSKQPCQNYITFKKDTSVGIWQLFPLLLCRFPVAHTAIKLQTSFFRIIQCPTNFWTGHGRNKLIHPTKAQAKSKGKG